MPDPTLVQARSDAYHVLGTALLDGLTPQTLDLLGEVSALGDLTAQPPSAEVLSAEHYRVFGLNVYPYAGVFLSVEGLMGGIQADAAADFYAQIGFQPSGDADHIGAQLGALAWLAGAEADALADGQMGQVARVRGLRRRFLDERVLTWLPALAKAVESQGAPLYTAVAHLALELAVDDRAALGDDLMAVGEPFGLPPAPDLLADPKTSLRDIAVFLTTSAHAGVYLSRDDITRLALRHRVPTGFTDRTTLLHNVLRSAVDYGVFAALVEDLRETAAGWTAYFGVFDLPSCAVWGAAAARTAEMLAQVRDGVLSG